MHVRDVERPAGRHLGLDVARALAILGMFIAHFGASWSQEPGGWTTSVVRFTDGRAMPLFVVLSGAGLSLLMQRSTRPARSIVARAAVLLLLGLAFEFTTIVAVILQFYALFLLAGLAFRRLGDRWLLVSAAAVVLLGVIAQRYVYDLLPVGSEHMNFETDTWGALPWLAEPGVLLSDLFVTGYYPFFPTMAFVLVGMWLGRQDLRSMGLRRGIALSGFVMAVVGYGVGWATDGRRGPIWEVEDRAAESWWRVLDASGHSDMPAWMIGSTGAALVAIGLCLVAVDRMPRVTRPFALAGQLALTLYVAHLAALRWWLEEWPWAWGPAETLAGAAGVFGVGVLLAVVWRLRFTHGPLESVLRLVGPAR